MAGRDQHQLSVLQRCLAFREFKYSEMTENSRQGSTPVVCLVKMSILQRCTCMLRKSWLYKFECFCWIKNYEGHRFCTKKEDPLREGGGAGFKRYGKLEHQTPLFPFPYRFVSRKTVASNSHKTSYVVESNITANITVESNTAANQIISYI